MFRRTFLKGQKMKIHGREVKFLKTVKGTSDIAKLCPNNDIKLIGNVFGGDDIEAMQNAMAVCIVAMNEGYEYNKKWEVEGYEPNPLTLEEVMYLDHDVFLPLFSEAMKCFRNDKQTVEVEPPKTKKKATNK